MNHGKHTWQTVPNGQPGDTATIDGEHMTRVLCGMWAQWLPTDIAHMTHVRDGQ